MAMTGDDAAPCRVSAEPLRAGAAVILGGDIDYGAIDHLNAAYATVEAAPPGHVTVDLRDTTFVDSVGLGFLVQLYRHAKASGHEVLVTRASPWIAHKITLTGLDGVLTVVDARPAVVAD